MIVVVAALKGGVGKTTTAVYLAALAAGSRKSAILVDADPQASSADWIETAPDDQLEAVTPLEAPTDRLLTRALSRIDGEEVAVVDTPPGNERLLAKAIDLADVVIVPVRVGGIENARVEAVVGMVPVNVPLGLVICSAADVHARLPAGGGHVGGGGCAAVGHGPGTSVDCRGTGQLAVG